MKIIKPREKHYILVDDSEIKEGNYYVCWETINGVPSNHEISNKSLHSFCIGADNYKKITHSTQPLSDKPHYAEYGMLNVSEVEEAIYGYSVEKMAEDATNLRILKHKTPNQVARQYFDGYVEGFNAHKELVKDKLFTVEDMKKALIMMGLITAKEPQGSAYKVDELIQSLLPKTEWECTIDEQGKIILL